MLAIGIDTGGTFTDFIWHDGQRWQVHKRLSTPANPAQAVIQGLGHIIGSSQLQHGKVVHGSTVATNALLERRGALTALITNAGFEDVIEIGRQQRPKLYDLNAKRAPALVARDCRFGVAGRIDTQGHVITPLDTAAVQQLKSAIAEKGIESIAISLLFSFNNPEHELAVANILQDLELPISLSHEILPEFREYERSSTTVINAYVAPKMRTYIQYLQDSLPPRSLRIMQSNGGSISADTAMRESVRTILSGPAGGAVAALEMGKAAGFDKIMSFDMGGTSTDVALLDRSLPMTMEAHIADQPIKVPMINIHTVGAGGGSIAWPDGGGALRVGPKSAGADPGPACYGRGQDVTVTDANLYLGRLVAEHFLGGHMSLDKSRINAPMNQLAKVLDVPADELADGILRVANATMERALRVISVERGHDPREFTLVCFGGAGGLHAADLARELGISQVLIPCRPGTLSASGMLLADVIKDYSQTLMLGDTSTMLDALAAPLETLQRRATEELKSEGIRPSQITLRAYADMRYQGQSFEIMVPLDTDPIAGFHRLHEKLYGYCDRQKPTEMVTLRVRAIGEPAKPPMERIRSGEASPPPKAQLSTQTVYFDGAWLNTSIWDRQALLAGNQILGPAIIVEYTSTVVVPPFAHLRVDDWGNLILQIKISEEAN